jgi:pimeloyl-ACP methyl ester carboxylesterase
LTERPFEWTGESPYGPQAQTDLVIALMDELNIEKAFLVGNSAGGTVSMQVALQHPERVKALILVDAAVFAGGGAPTWSRPILKTPQMDHLGPLIARQLQAQGTEFLKTAFHDPSKITPDIFEGYQKPLQAENWDKALWQLTVASQESGLVERLSEFAMPILVITGDDDRIVPTEQSLRLADELPNAMLSVIPQSGHLPHEESPAEFMQAVTEFLSTLK